MGARLPIKPASPLKEKPAQLLQVRAFRKVECVLDVDAEIADRALDLGMTEQS